MHIMQHRSLQGGVEDARLVRGRMYGSCCVWLRAAAGNVLPSAAGIGVGSDCTGGIGTAGSAMLGKVG